MLDRRLNEPVAEQLANLFVLHWVLRKVGCAYEHSKMMWVSSDS